MSDHPRRSILIVDDESSIRESLRMVLKNEYDCHLAANAQEALEAFERDSPDLVLLDIRMPDMSGIALLERMKGTDPDAVVIMLTAVTSIRHVVDAMKRGAEEYLCKPFDVSEVKLVIEKALEKTSLRREVQRLRSEVTRRYRFANLVGKSKQMRAIYDLVERIADKKTTILIRGESGTGKELVAKAIHYNGVRKDKPFVTVNCAAIPDNLIESELFGHERGAFTDAVQSRAGQFELADGGTIFLDEIGELSPLTQTKLLRVLQEREFRRVGAPSSIRVDVRVIAATNADLDSAIADGRFRSDLYYRLNVVTLALPPLRERREDVPLLVEHFLIKYREQGDPERELDAATMEALTAYAWPGNVRELENTIERALALSQSSRVTIDDIPQAIVEGGQTMRIRSDVLSGQLGLEDAVETFEGEIISAALDREGWVQTRTADLLGVSRRILKYKMDKYGIKANRKDRT